MTWTTRDDWKTREDIVRYFENEYWKKYDEEALPFVNDGLPFELVGSTVTGKTIYQLVRNLIDETRFIAVVLLEENNGQWSYAVMTEALKPARYDCPIEFLDESNDEHGWAVEWREECRKQQAKKSLFTQSGKSNSLIA